WRGGPPLRPQPRRRRRHQGCDRARRRGARPDAACADAAHRRATAPVAGRDDSVVAAGSPASRRGGGWRTRGAAGRRLDSTRARAADCRRRRGSVCAPRSFRAAHRGRRRVRRSARAGAAAAHPGSSCAARCAVLRQCRPGAGFAPVFLDLDAWRRDRALPAEDDGNPDWVRLGNHVVSRDIWGAFAASLHAALAAFHAENPDAAGAAPDTLRRVVEPRFPAPLFAAALAELARQGIVAMAGGLVRATDHDARLNAIQLALWQNLKPLLEAQRFQPPRVAELCAPLKLTEAAARRALKQLAALGLVEEVAPDHFFLRGAVADAVAIVATLGDNFGAARLR